MKRFMAMLNRNKNKDPPPARLLELAGQLCQELQSSAPSLEKLVGAVMGCKHKMYFLTNIHVVRACVFVHIRNRQHDTACRLLEHCKAEEKEELVQLWHEIHYQRVMEKHHTDFLTPLQKFRCRKRNPPPMSLCPEGLKNRNYPDEVRQQLHRFAAEVTTNPSKEQREGLARDTNLQPTQVYNWFANYRRRQKSCLSLKEKLHSSCPERALIYHRKEQQDKESYTPQTADGSCVGTGSEQMEITFMPCDPGWEQSAADLDKPPEGTYLKMLESSCVQSSELYEAMTSEAWLTTHNMEQPVPFCTEAVLEPGTCFSSTVLQPRAAGSSTDTSPQLDHFVLCPCGSLAFPGEWLPIWQPPCSTRGVSGSTWTPSIEGVRAPLSRVPQGGCVEASSGRLIQQSDLEIESFILREGQLGTLESILPHSSSLAVLGKPQCPPAPAPCMEEGQALGQSQVLGDPVGDPLANDTFWAAWLLFEFSAGGRM
ncbi:PREDICTED: anomalous homeobox protein isoform X3 [Calidris pugnax]|uniref:anomalous homeobox protein isoform X3 n=1 Tax=Calidris pugnax TaxID=198806 RepID=UPI00071C645C|nr:PREDICTED: anomalous homeobox protein isoform X3 [Calidris pugnax]